MHLGVQLWPQKYIACFAEPFDLRTIELLAREIRPPLEQPASAAPAMPGDGIA